MCFWWNYVQFLSLALFVRHFLQYCVQCASDSKQLSYEDLRSIEKGSEMLQLVHPVKNSSPLIFKHHSYTHISVDSSQNSNGHFPVLFLSLSEYSSWRRAKNSVRFRCLCAFWLHKDMPGVLKFESWNCTPELGVLRESLIVDVDLLHQYSVQRICYIHQGLSQFVTLPTTGLACTLSHF